MNDRKKTHSGERGHDGSKTKNKGEGEESKQKGATSVSHDKAGTRRKDESHGADENTTKKQSNSI